MQLNPSPDNYRIRYSELFEAGVYRLKKSFPHIFEALDDIELWLKKTPDLAGEPIKVFKDRDMWLMVTAKTPRYPGLRVLYEIGPDWVVCWHIAERDHA